jgi:hypothetical protein
VSIAEKISGTLDGVVWLSSPHAAIKTHKATAINVHRFIVPPGAAVRRPPPRIFEQDERAVAS